MKTTYDVKYKTKKTLKVYTKEETVNSLEELFKIILKSYKNRDRNRY